METEMFQIVFWSCVVLGAVMGGSILTLMKMDPTTDALLYSDDPLKRDL